MPIQVLIAEGDRELRETVCRFLRGRGYGVRSTSDGRRALRLVRQGAFDVAFLDLRIPGAAASRILAANVDRGASARPIVAMTDEQHIYEAVAALRSGVFEYVTRPFQMAHLEWLIRRAVAAPAPDETHILYDGPPEASDTQPLFGFSRSMREVFRAIDRAAQAVSPVLLVGDAGTGRQLVARAVHRMSARSDGPFVGFHPGTIPADEVGRTLFGGPGGPGLLQKAEGGSLFIDEVSRLSTEEQGRLLRLLGGRQDDSEYEDLGGADVRLITATRLDLMSRVRGGAMGSDFYWFVRTLTIRMPPLRERPEDILPLARFILAREARAAGMPQRILAPAAMHWLQEHRWPGNVRELQSVLVRGLTAASGMVIQLDDLAGPSRRLDEDVDGAPTESFEDLVLNRLRPVVRSFVPGPEGSDLYRLVKETAEKAVITLAMEQCRGNQLKAAQLLGINRNTLRAKLDAFGIVRVRGGRR